MLLCIWPVQAKHLITSLVYFPVVLNYIGPRRRAAGDWCFCDHYILFRDMADLYTQHFTGNIRILIVFFNSRTNHVVKH